MAQGSINYSVFTRVAFFTTLAFGACGANIALIAFRTRKLAHIGIVTDALGKLLGGVCGKHGLLYHVRRRLGGFCAARTRGRRHLVQYVDRNLSHALLVAREYDLAHALFRRGFDRHADLIVRADAHLHRSPDRRVKRR